MKPYNEVDHDSGVVAYDGGTGEILVRFKDGSTCEYADSGAGASNTAEMKRLASAGDGANAFNNKYVRTAYSRRAG